MLPDDADHGVAGGAAGYVALTTEKSPPTARISTTDSKEARTLVVGRLKVMTLTDGFEAVEIAARSQPTLMIVDRMLPGMEGLDVCRLARAHPGLVDMGVPVLSALGSEDDRVEGLLAGADDYVVKPFSVREVIARARVRADRMRYDAGDAPRDDSFVGDRVP